MEAGATTVGWWIVGTTGFFALLVSAASIAEMATGRRRVVRYATALGTLAHEAGHAAIAGLTGGGVAFVQVSSPHSGLTYTWLDTRFSAILTKAAGYAMPPLLGLGAALLIHQGKAYAVLTLTVAAAVALLVVTRDGATLACVTIVGGLSFAALYWGTPWWQTTVAYLEAWVLLTSEIAGLVTLVLIRWHGQTDDDDDAAGLARLTRIPGVVWIAGWAALMGWALWRALPLLFL